VRRLSSRLRLIKNNKPYQNSQVGFCGWRFLRPCRQLVNTTAITAVYTSAPCPQYVTAVSAIVSHYFYVLWADVIIKSRQASIMDGCKAYIFVVGRPSTQNQAALAHQLSARGPSCITSDRAGILEWRLH
jgi:hypothetical protein